MENEIKTEIGYLEDEIKTEIGYLEDEIMAECKTLLFLLNKNDIRNIEPCEKARSIECSARIVSEKRAKIEALRLLLKRNIKHN